MPKLKNNELVVTPSVTDEELGETIEMGDNVYPLEVNPDRPTHFRFGKPLKYDYDPSWSQEEKQSHRRKMRRQAERLAAGKPLNPNQNRVKKSDEEKSQARRDRRNIRNDVKWEAYAMLAKTVPEYQGMTAYEVYQSLRDNLVNG